MSDTYTGHTDGFTATTWSSDGSQLLTGDGENLARLWDVATGAIVQVYKGHTNDVMGVGFSPDQTKVITASRDNTVKIWNKATGAEEKTLIGHTGAVYCAVFSPDGTKVLTGSEDDTAKLWDYASGSVIATVTGGHTSYVRQVAFSPLGNQFVTTGGGTAAQVVLWDTATQGFVRSFTKTGSNFTPGALCVKFSPDGAKIAVGQKNDDINVWDVAAGGEPLVTLSGHKFDVATLDWSPDGTRILSGAYGLEVYLWDWAADALVRSFDKSKLSIWAVQYSPDGQRILSSGGDGAVYVWDLATGGNSTPTPTPSFTATPTRTATPTPTPTGPPAGGPYVGLFQLALDWQKTSYSGPSDLDQNGNVDASDVIKFIQNAP